MPQIVQPPPSRFGQKVLIIGLILVLGISVLMNLGLLAALGGGADHNRVKPYHATLIEGEGPEQILIVDVHGEISDHRGGSFLGESMSMAERVKSQLRQAERDEHIRAVILSVNSPGGGVTASDDLRHSVQRLQKAGKKVVVHMGDLCASGGYYLVAPADVLIASPTTITGSIGVILPLVDAHELLEKKLGIAYTPVKSGPFKDMTSMARHLRAEERALLQDLVDEMHNRFVDIVAEGRQGHGRFKDTTPEATRAAVRILADGRVYTAQAALENGMVDELGYLDDAITRAKAVSGLSQASVVRYRREQGLFGMLGADNSGININAGTQLGIDGATIDRVMSPALEYRWYPALP
jgi:protease IV